MNTNVQFINPEGLKVRSHFSQLVVFQPGQMILLSGQVGINIDGETISAHFDRQLQQSLKNVEIALRSANCSWQHVVQIRFYVVELCYERRLLIELALAELFEEKSPVSSLIGIQKLARPDLHLEIEALAIL